MEEATAAMILAEFPGETITLRRAAFGDFFWPTDEQIGDYQLACNLGKYIDPVLDAKGKQKNDEEGVPRTVTRTFSIRDVKGNAVNEDSPNAQNEIYLEYLVDDNENRVKPAPGAETKQICFCIPENVKKTKHPEIEYSPFHEIPKRYFDQVLAKLDSRVLIPAWPETAMPAATPEEVLEAAEAAADEAEKAVQAALDAVEKARGAKEPPKAKEPDPKKKADK